MSTFILIHGLWHGAWCWERLSPLLTMHGHTVVTPDMPGMGNDRTPTSQATFSRAMATIVASIDAAAEPVILVGHSHGGILIAQAAEEHPDRVAKLVYLTGFIPKTGDSTRSLAMQDHGIVRFGLEISADQTSTTVRDDWIKASFYTDCSDDDVTWAKARLRPQPMEPYAHPVNITKERSGRVPSIYLECLRDHTITPGFQRKMYREHICETVLSLDTGHSPFLSAPESLAKHLLAIQP